MTEPTENKAGKKKNRAVRYICTAAAVVAVLSAAYFFTGNSPDKLETRSSPAASSVSQTKTTTLPSKTQTTTTAPEEPPAQTTTTVPDEPSSEPGDSSKSDTSKPSQTEPAPAVTEPQAETPQLPLLQRPLQRPPQQNPLSPSIVFRCSFPAKTPLPRIPACPTA